MVDIIIHNQDSNEVYIYDLIDFRLADKYPSGPWNRVQVPGCPVGSKPNVSGSVGNSIVPK